MTQNVATTCHFVVHKMKVIVIDLFIYMVWVLLILLFYFYCYIEYKTYVYCCGAKLIQYTCIDSYLFLTELGFRLLFHVATSDHAKIFEMFVPC